MEKKRIKQRVVEDLDRPLWEQESLEIFQAAGWGEDAGWLSALALPIAVDPLDREKAPDEMATYQLRVVAASWHEAGPLPDRDRALLMAYARLCGCGGKNGCIGESLRDMPDGSFRKFRGTVSGELRRPLGAAFHERKADFEGALVRGGWPGDYSGGDPVNVWLMHRQHGVEATGRMPLAETGCPALVPLLRLLVEDAGLDPLKVVDQDEMVATAVHCWPRDFGAPSGPRQPVPTHGLRLDMTSPRSMGAWVGGLGPAVMLRLLPGLEAQPDDRVAGVALGARRILEEWLSLAVGHWTHFSRASGVLGPATLPWFQLLHRRAVAAGSAAGPALRRSWLWFAWCAFDADRNAWVAQEEVVRRAVLQAANEEVARARKILSKAGTTAPSSEGLLGAGGELGRPAVEEFLWGQDLLSICSMVLFELGGVWRGLKPMLLAWRALTAPAVASDLRYWPEPGREPPPSPWSVLVLWPMNMFHHVVGREQKQDLTLAELRGQIASFCLERLTDRLSENQRKAGKQRTDFDMVESSPDWRYCLIRAAISLGVNPEGKGHRILHKSMEIDPDEDVRDAAKDGYERLRRNVGLPDGVSPRRAVTSALWWLRQAHLLGLGIEPDRDGAQRTRIKELSRTKEEEQRDALHPAPEN
jgi:hypothetical protein